MILHRFDDNGRYTTSIATTWAGAEMEDQSRVFIGDVDVSRQYHDLATNLPVDMPPKPSEFHDFDYTRKQWVANPEAAWASVKQKRARLLAGSDWMVTKATESGQAVPPVWMAYRQALRDITLQADPWAIVWPVAP